MLSSIIQHDQLWWRIKRVLNFDRRKLFLLIFYETNHLWIEHELPHTDLQDSTRVDDL
ncbi:hypothetical protein Hanom_Chr15g01406601 [Helianthus anomalus]